MVFQPVVRQVVYTTRGESVHGITVTQQYWRLGIPVIVIATCATRELAHNNG